MKLKKLDDAETDVSKFLRQSRKMSQKHRDVVAKLSRLIENSFIHSLDKRSSLAKQTIFWDIDFCSFVGS